MGLFRKPSGSAYDKTPPALPNPDPKNFSILRNARVGNGLVVEVLYPDCTNYEGRKILVYAGVTITQLSKQASLDPHFCDNPDYHSPVARFEPTERGWALAVHAAEQL